MYVAVKPLYEDAPEIMTLKSGHYAWSPCYIEKYP